MTRVHPEELRWWHQQTEEERLPPTPPDSPPPQPQHPRNPDTYLEDHDDGSSNPD